MLKVRPGDRQVRSLAFRKSMRWQGECERESRRRGSNPRPIVYETIALPLSYFGEDCDYCHMETRLPNGKTSADKSFFDERTKFSGLITGEILSEFRGKSCDAAERVSQIAAPALVVSREPRMESETAKKKAPGKHCPRCLRLKLLVINDGSHVRRRCVRRHRHHHRRRHHDDRRGSHGEVRRSVLRHHRRRHHRRRDDLHGDEPR